MTTLPSKPRTFVASRLVEVRPDDPDYIRAQLAEVPERPGVYRLSGPTPDRTLYVGMTGNLRDRLTTHLLRGSLPEPRLYRLRADLRYFEYFVVETLSEARNLERALIETEKPELNIQFRDDKNFPYVHLNLNEPYPRPEIVRRHRSDEPGHVYFGPYSNPGSSGRVMQVIRRHFRLASCTRDLNRVYRSACLYYHIGRCLGPCIRAVSPEEYRAEVDRLARFLQGRYDELLEELTRRMEEAAERLEFERAREYRDQIRDIRGMLERKRVVQDVRANYDLLAPATLEEWSCVQVLPVRQGMLLRWETFSKQDPGAVDAPVLLAAFIREYYESATDLPDEIIVPVEVEGEEFLADWLSERRGAPVTIRRPASEAERQQLELGLENARQWLEHRRRTMLAAQDARQQALFELQEALGLPTVPRRIECYDISTLQGAAPVGSMVVFENGVARRQHYRKFKIKTVAGQDDYSMLREVLGRRLRRARGPALRVDGPEPVELVPAGSEPGAFRDPWSVLPDLVVIDGGRGQLNAALEVLRDLGFEWLPVIGLAKENEDIYLPDSPEPLNLPRTSPALRLLQQIRDEAHRFAVTYHRQTRERTGMRSVLEQVKGIGPKRRLALLKAFGSARGILAASEDEIAAVPGMTKKLAALVKTRLAELLPEDPRLQN